MHKILVIGAHGMLGRPLVRRLLREGFFVRALARDPGKAQPLLPPTAEVIEGNLENPEDIRRAAEGVEAVYLNLSTPNPKADFRPELEGTRTVIQALKNREKVLIAKISALGANPTSGKWLDADFKVEAEEAIKACGHPFLIFRPSWFYESLPLFIRGRRFFIFGRQPHPLHWIAGDDYGKMVATAFKKNIENRVFNVQGDVALTMEEAMRRFARACGQEYSIMHLPLGLLKIMGTFNPQMLSLYHLMHYCEHHIEKQESRTTWEILGKPAMTVEDFVAYMKKTGDVPSK